MFAARTEIAPLCAKACPDAAGAGSAQSILDILVAAQIAIGLVLVNAAALLMVSYSNVVSQQMNFDTDEVLVAGISLSGPAYEEPHQRRAFFEELLGRSAAFPALPGPG